MTAADSPARAAASLIRAHRWAALGTTGPEGPSVSFVAYAPETGLDGILVFLSGLSRHTGNLLHDPRASLGVTEVDDGEGDPQTLARVSLHGRVQLVRRESDHFAEKWELYHQRFPAAGRLISLFDFALFRFEIDTARFVGGFAAAATLKGDELRRAASEA